MTTAQALSTFLRGIPVELFRWEDMDLSFCRPARISNGLLCAVDTQSPPKILVSQCKETGVVPRFIQIFPTREIDRQIHSDIVAPVVVGGELYTLVATPDGFLQIYRHSLWATEESEGSTSFDGGVMKTVQPLWDSHERVILLRAACETPREPPTGPRPREPSVLPFVAAMESGKVHTIGIQVWPARANRGDRWAEVKWGSEAWKNFATREEQGSTGTILMTALTRFARSMSGKKTRRGQDEGDEFEDEDEEDENRIRKGRVLDLCVFCDPNWQPASRSPRRSRSALAEVSSALGVSDPAPPVPAFRCLVVSEGGVECFGYTDLQREQENELFTASRRGRIGPKPKRLWRLSVGAEGSLIRVGISNTRPIGALLLAEGDPSPLACSLPKVKVAQVIFRNEEFRRIDRRAALQQAGPTGTAYATVEFPAEFVRETIVEAGHCRGPLTNFGGLLQLEVMDEEAAVAFCPASLEEERGAEGSALQLLSLAPIEEILFPSPEAMEDDSEPRPRPPIIKKQVVDVPASRNELIFALGPALDRGSTNFPHLMMVSNRDPTLGAMPLSSDGTHTFLPSDNLALQLRSTRRNSPLRGFSPPRSRWGGSPPRSPAPPAAAAAAAAGPPGAFHTPPTRNRYPDVRGTAGGLTGGRETETVRGFYSPSRRKPQPQELNAALAPGATLPMQLGMALALFRYTDGDRRARSDAAAVGEHLSELITQIRNRSFEVGSENTSVDFSAAVVSVAREKSRFNVSNDLPGMMMGDETAEGGGMGLGLGDLSAEGMGAYGGRDSDSMERERRGRMLDSLRRALDRKEAEQVMLTEMLLRHGDLMDNLEFEGRQALQEERERLRCLLVLLDYEAEFLKQRVPDSDPLSEGFGAAVVSALNVAGMRSSEGPNMRVQNWVSFFSSGSLVEPFMEALAVFVRDRIQMPSMDPGHALVENMNLVMRVTEVAKTLLSSLSQIRDSIARHVHLTDHQLKTREREGLPHPGRLLPTAPPLPSYEHSRWALSGSLITAFEQIEALNKMVAQRLTALQSPEETVIRWFTSFSDFCSDQGLFVLGSSMRAAQPPPEWPNGRDIQEANEADHKRLSETFQALSFCEDIVWTWKSRCGLDQIPSMNEQLPSQYLEKSFAFAQIADAVESLVSAAITSAFRSTEATMEWEGVGMGMGQVSGGYRVELRWCLFELFKILEAQLRAGGDAVLGQGGSGDCVVVTRVFDELEKNGLKELLLAVPFQDHEELWKAVSNRLNEDGNLAWISAFLNGKRSAASEILDESQKLQGVQTRDWAQVESTAAKMTTGIYACDRAEQAAVSLLARRAELTLRRRDQKRQYEACSGEEVMFQRVGPRRRMAPEGEGDAAPMDVDGQEMGEREGLGSGQNSEMFRHPAAWTAAGQEMLDALPLFVEDLPEENRVTAAAQARNSALILSLRRCRAQAEGLGPLFGLRDPQTVSLGDDDVMQNGRRVLSVVCAAFVGPRTCKPLPARVISLFGSMVTLLSDLICDEFFNDDFPDELGKKAFENLFECAIEHDVLKEFFSGESVSEARKNNSLSALLLFTLARTKGLVREGSRLWDSAREIVARFAFNGRGGRGTLPTRDQKLVLEGLIVSAEARWTRPT